jgi:regulator of sigma E protease
MFGDTDPASAGQTDQVKDGEQARPMTAQEREEAFFSKSVWKRSAIVFAGPAINFLFAIILFTGLYAVHGKVVTPPMASAIIADSAADKAGFEPHDKVIAIDGQRIERFEDVRRIVMVALDTPLDFTVTRGNEEIVLTATPEKLEMTDRFGFSHSRGMLGIIGPSQGLAIKNIVSVNGQKYQDEDRVRQALLNSLGRDTQIGLKRGEEKTDTLFINPSKELNEGLLDVNSPDFGVLVVANSMDQEVIEYGVVQGFTSAVHETWTMTMSTLEAIGQIFTGTRSATELGGVIRIGAIAGDMAQAGLIALITFTALISINLGLINLFPIPMLDGGHLVFYAIEAIKGKPVPERVQEYAFRVGFVILIGLMLFTNINDIVQLVM